MYFEVGVLIVFGGLSNRCHCCTFSKGELVIQSEKYHFVKTFAFVSSVSDTLGGIVLNWSNNLFIMAVGQFGTRTFWHRTIWHQERIYVLIIVRQYNFLHIVSKSKKKTHKIITLFVLWSIMFKTIRVILSIFWLLAK